MGNKKDDWSDGRSEWARGLTPSRPSQPTNRPNAAQANSRPQFPGNHVPQYGSQPHLNQPNSSYNQGSVAGQSGHYPQPGHYPNPTNQPYQALPNRTPYSNQNTPYHNLPPQALPRFGQAAYPNSPHGLPPANYGHSRAKAGGTPKVIFLIALAGFVFVMFMIGLVVVNMDFSAFKSGRDTNSAGNAVQTPDRQKDDMVRSLKLTHKGNDILQDIDELRVYGFDEVQEACGNHEYSASLQDTHYYGCYVGKIIYIDANGNGRQDDYEIPKLAGDRLIVVNTPNNQEIFAHEFLHAVFFRMTIAEQNQISGDLETAYRNNRDILDPFLSAYDFRDNQQQRLNELHSFIGTRVENIPSGLEAHYAEYFEDRSIVTAFAADSVVDSAASPIPDTSTPAGVNPQEDGGFQCPDGTIEQYPSFCKVQCPDGTWALSEYFCKVQCPDGSWVDYLFLCDSRGSLDRNLSYASRAGRP